MGLFQALLKTLDYFYVICSRENRAKGGGICVANHTSPIDTIVLGCDNVYAMVGQAQGGFMGTMQRAMSRAEHHIWFQRSEAKDRLAVARRWVPFASLNLNLLPTPHFVLF